jgi:hypothetical protein
MAMAAAVFGLNAVTFIFYVASFVLVARAVVDIARQAQWKMSTRRKAARSVPSGDANPSGHRVPPWERAVRKILVGVAG